MIKKTTATSINILSVFIILISVFISCVGQTNAWFTAGYYKGIAITAVVGELNVNLYQYENVDDMDDSEEKGTKIFTIANNKETTTNPKSYVDFSGEIIPDKPIDLCLKIKNDDLGATAMYLRFKLELYSRNSDADVLIPIEISGMQSCGTDSYGFVKGTEDWWYYQYNVTDNEYKSNNNVEFIKGREATLSTGITIPYASFIDENNNLKLINSDTLLIKITIYGSIHQKFTE